MFPRRGQIGKFWGHFVQPSIVAEGSEQPAGLSGLDSKKKYVWEHLLYQERVAVIRSKFLEKCISFQNDLSKQ